MNSTPEFERAVTRVSSPRPYVSMQAAAHVVAGASMSTSPPALTTTASDGCMGTAELMRTEPTSGFGGFETALPQCCSKSAASLLTVLPETSISCRTNVPNHGRPQAPWPVTLNSSVG